jgi:purine nucleoside permease
MDARFDVAHAYWLVAGIAGINPLRGSIGSAAWAEWVVDGDLAREIDSREIPADWKTGYLPLRGSVPYDCRSGFGRTDAGKDGEYFLARHAQ